MKMKKYILSLALAFIAININSQTSTEIIPTPNDSRVITTGVPFLLIASDARAASMGDMGVATSVDTYSQFWNPSKYVFSETKSGFGLSYTKFQISEPIIENLNFKTLGKLSNMPPPVI